MMCLTHNLNPARSPGVHLPFHSDDWSPELFKLYFDSEIVNVICDASNEYAERNKNKYTRMYSYFKRWSHVISIVLLEYLFIWVIGRYHMLDSCGVLLVSVMTH